MEEPAGLVATSGRRGSFPTGVIVQGERLEAGMKRGKCRVDCI